MLGLVSTYIVESHYLPIGSAAPPQKLRFEPLRQPRAFEEVCARIRDQLAIGALKPGDKLPAERDLAQQLRVSRSALREALRPLI